MTVVVTQLQECLMLEDGYGDGTWYRTGANCQHNIHLFFLKK
jgi:hypothetical protein